MIVQTFGDMARVKQYPHYLFVETPTESTPDANGDYSESTIELTFVSKCREESDGRGNEYDSGNGTFVKSSAVIQCPKSCPAIAKGAKVFVSNDDECTDIRISGMVLNCDKAQLHTRVWL